MNKFLQYVASWLGNREDQIIKEITPLRTNTWWERQRSFFFHQFEFYIWHLKYIDLSSLTACRNWNRKKRNEGREGKVWKTWRRLRQSKNNHVKESKVSTQSVRAFFESTWRTDVSSHSPAQFCLRRSLLSFIYLFYLLEMLNTTSLAIVTRDYIWRRPVQRQNQLKPSFYFQASRKSQTKGRAKRLWLAAFLMTCQVYAHSN